MMTGAMMPVHYSQNYAKTELEPTNRIQGGCVVQVSWLVPGWFLAGRLVGWLAGWLVGSWLVSGWLAGWFLVGSWLVGWLVHGWLAVDPRWFPLIGVDWGDRFNQTFIRNQ